METKIQALEISMAELKTDLKYIKDSVRQNTIEHREMINKIDGFIEVSESRFADKKDHKELIEQIACLDDKYAPKMAWTVLVWTGSIVGAAIILGIIGLIAETYLHIFNKIN